MALGARQMERIQFSLGSRIRADTGYNLLVTNAATSTMVFELSTERAQRIAAEFGTPAYVVDESSLRKTIRRYVAAFRAAYPQSEVTFASKANSTAAIVKIAHQEGCKIDAASEGEFRAALLAGVPAADCHLHGNNKSHSEIEFALARGIGQIIVDHFGEIDFLASKLPFGKTQVLLRLAPGVDPLTHAKISTGQADTKFGFNVADGSAKRAVEMSLAAGLPLVGFHCHVGSQLLDPSAQITGGQILAQFAAEVKSQLGFEAKVINIGGGLGVPYTAQDTPMPVETYCQEVVKAIQAEWSDPHFQPILVQEPGRSLVAASGVTLYSVGAIKSVPAHSGRKAYVAVDGGLSDNPRPALYGSRYTVKPILTGSTSPYSLGAALNVSSGSVKATISGKHCETDRLFEDAELPAELSEGDLLQVLCTGAYGSSMASNYNRFLRPPTVLIRESGEMKLIQNRETYDQLFAREVGLD